MRMMRPSARGGTTNWLKRYLRQLHAKLEAEFNATGGMFMYRADSGPLDGGHYDDPHKPREVTELNKDLEGWEPLF